MSLIERLRALSPESRGPLYGAEAYFINPDGPEAATQLEAMQAEIDQRDRFIAEISKELREIRAIIEARASLDRQGK